MTTKRAPAYLRRLVDRYDPTVVDLPAGSARIGIKVDDVGRWDAVIDGDGCRLEDASRKRPDARISAGAAVWRGMERETNTGMAAFQRGRLRVRDDLNLGIGFIAATSEDTSAARLRFFSIEIDVGRISCVSAGEEGDGLPLLCIHGLGATKASFMPTISALAEERRVIAIDLPGFGDSAKPVDAPYDAAWFAGIVAATMDQLGLERAHLAGNSMGGRVAIECGLQMPERVASLSLLAPALAWLRDRPFTPLLSLPLSKLGLIHPAPRRLIEPIVRRLVPGARDGWTAAGVDEFLRAFTTSGGRYAFYESARRIYLDEPHGPEGFYRRLERMEPPSLFIWGAQDTLVPASFKWHVERALPAARHLDLDCGHVPQLERPLDAHAGISEFVAQAERTAVPI